MGTREFHDESGRRWVVWPVQPSASERRRGAPDVRPQPRSERRTRIAKRSFLRGDLANGWLTCETVGEKRRIAPIPEDWESLPEEELARLCRSAHRVPPSRRLVE